MEFAQEMRRRAEAALPQYIRDLTALVSIDSGSDDPAGVRRVADWVSARLSSLGFTVERHAPEVDPLSGEVRYGDALVARRLGTGTGRFVMFAHLDTVFQRGDAVARPFSMDDAGLAHGPGVTDDKAGVVAGLHVAQLLVEEGSERYGELVYVATPDEEIGSPFGRSVLAAAVQGADAAFCLECARENGDLVGSRKGVIDLELEVRGVAAHSGIEPERGAHAGLEAAHLTIFLQSLADLPSGVTVNVGVLRAGDRLNVVPDRAALSVEMRAPRAEQLDGLLAALRARIAAPAVRGTSIAIAELEECPPMEATEANVVLGVLAQRVAGEVGFAATLAATGGVSDANRVSALGVPTLDGLGPVGGGDHTPGEWLDTKTVPERVAFLAALIDTLGASVTTGADDVRALSAATPN